MNSARKTDTPISDVSAMIIVQSESRMVAYLGNGMTYSNEAKAKLRFNGRIDAMESENPGADPGNITISYLEHTVANPAGVPDTLTCPITNYKNAGFLLISAENDFANKITVTGIQINSPNFFPVFTFNENFVIDNGQTLTFEINRTLGEMINEDYTGDRVSAFYDVNALTFESMGFSEGVIKNHGSSWGYHYYLTDHLGSTRMVVTDGDELAGAYMYQPYGTIDEVVTAAVDQVREKFTGKEFDQEGEIEGVTEGIKLNYHGWRYYDPEIGLWISADRIRQFWNPYSYMGNGYNPINALDPDGRYVIYAVRSHGNLVGYRVQFETAFNAAFGFARGLIPGPMGVAISATELALETQKVNDPNYVQKTIDLAISFCGLKSVSRLFGWDKGAQLVADLTDVNFSIASTLIQGWDRPELINAFRNFYGYELFRNFASAQQAIMAIENVMKPTTVQVLDPVTNNVLGTSTGPATDSGGE